MNSFPSRLAHWAAATPGRVAMSCAGIETTYAGLWQRIECATSRLADEWGVVEGD
ncbi:MAG: long-chain fatty acid--CoA ligase, partial [Betaproteobacteria bacterium]|nr:long-chain fatty acid--CoA ligase [Betaproteobacteria bacterium]